jgi:hypothetical protein
LFKSKAVPFACICPICPDPKGTATLCATDEVDANEAVVANEAVNANEALTACKT